MSLEGRVDNLFDAHYQEIIRFPAPGRMLFVGVRMGK
jgi:outer membrane cobalamin receptor